MTTIIRDSAGTARTITAIQVRDASNTPQDISELWVRDSNNVPRLVFSVAPPMTAAAAPSTVSGFTLGTGLATTGNTTVTPTGGTAPYSYAWSLISYDNSTPPTAGSPTAATTNFTQTNIGIGQDFSATWRCTVTDSSPSPYTAPADVQAFWGDTS